ncbi:quinolinate synthetase [Scopulibacillus darangshiensis]|uniref:Quinolinate synthase n=1 Tax=Scopulibacillus darangshiensis TaxID=442528 RepID=A0A4V2SKH4_9BACL|nr:quinolinate synthase NadA [Scopulibacillus darangshiensis]TCP19126.1 quinolinate synthetase [Scopulibacillus darangshiensis]
MNVLDLLSKEQGMPESFYSIPNEELIQRAKDVKERLGASLYIPGHHYQKDEVIQFADDSGDSLALAKLSAKNKEAEYVVFCGVHFMAETADILTDEHQKVILPDLRAGCSMADMADIHQLERAWGELQAVFGDTILPMTYVNSTAAIKAFCGKHGGATVTSSNADAMLEWAFTQKKRVLFLPDQHLGRNTGVKMGLPLSSMTIWNPIKNEFEGGYGEDTKVILWKGHCSVHEKFTVENIKECRMEDPDINILVHPECSLEVVEQADFSGSTQYIIKKLEGAPAGSRWAIGTEMNLVNRLKQRFPDKPVQSLNPNMCPCLTMNRIDLPHLVWALEQVEAGEPVNIIKVDEDIARDAKLALDRMLNQAV